MGSFFQVIVTSVNEVVEHVCHVEWHMYVIFYIIQYVGCY